MMSPPPPCHIGSNIYIQDWSGPGRRIKIVEPIGAAAAVYNDTAAPQTVNCCQEGII